MAGANVNRLGCNTLDDLDVDPDRWRHYRRAGLRDGSDTTDGE